MKKYEKELTSAEVMHQGILEYHKSFVNIKRSDAIFLIGILEQYNGFGEVRRIINSLKKQTGFKEIMERDKIG